MLNTLRLKYGSKLALFKGENIYAFPTLDQLSEVSESSLRGMGFGYR